MDFVKIKKKFEKCLCFKFPNSIYKENEKNR